jgi:AraC family transcriptional regulator of adaptative response/methylated-DNA-[protein]-cysteine methyltransferase
MEAQEQLQFDRVHAAIRYIHEHFREQPSLDEVAAHVHLSPYHFQRLFTEWAGVSPKKFLQYTSIAYARQLLQQDAFSLSDAAFETGLSGTGRLHDLFISIEAMTPGVYKQGGAGLQIAYSFEQSLFGPLLVASTDIGICYMVFADEPVAALETLREHYPAAVLYAESRGVHKAAARAFGDDTDKPERLRLHLQGSAFQLKVWETLLRIPPGRVSSYGAIASALGSPAASRAVGSAVGANPVALLIPCHRVIRATGVLGDYHWGAARKAALIGWEAARTGALNEL